ncbi:MAG: tetratricopeptide repeat protein [Desulfatitalea sp.]
MSPLCQHETALEWRSIFEIACARHAEGRLEEAMRGYQEALKCKPDLCESHFNSGLIHLHRKQWHAAIDAYQKVLKHKPEWPEAHFNMAQAYEQAGLPEPAIQAYGRALELRPDYFEACYNLGSAHLNAKEYVAAVRHLSQATQQRKVCPEVYNNLGQAYEGLNQLDHAEQCYAKAYAMDPSLLAACFNLAQRMKANGRLDDATRLYKDAIAKHPDSASAVNNLGNIFRDQQRYDEAVACYRQVIALEPNLAEGHYNLGSTLRLHERFEEALIHLHRAVQLRPDYADAWNNLALTCKNIGYLDRALSCFNRALSINPELAVAHWNRSFVHLLKEDFSAGWIDFEWRFRLPQRTTIYPFQLEGERWSGQSVPDATLLVHDEQGLGDTLQFVRYLPLVKARCRRVILETRAELVDLLARQGGVDQIIIRSSDGKPAATYDYYVPLMSLPGIFHATAETIPSEESYIVADSRKTERWRAKLPSSHLKVGLVWSGRPQHTNDRNRSCRLSDLRPLLEIPDVHFVGLQKGAAAEQSADLPVGIHFVNLGDDLKDFSDTAGLLAHLDLLIGVDTAVVHLAGAMGKPTWVMIPFIPDWRWGMHREDSRWYPSLRLFRQKRPKDWGGVVERMRRDLLGEVHQPKR